MSPVILTYVPVLHEGYRQLFARHPEARELYLFGPDIIASFEHLIKDIRKLDPVLIQKAISSWGLFDHVEILNEDSIKQLQVNRTPLIVSDDEITGELVTKHFVDNPIIRDTVFLRWDKKTSIEPVQVSPDVKISQEDFDRHMITLVSTEGTKSHDWWRRLGCVAMKDGQTLFTVHNDYVPNELIAYDEGDPRGNFKSGVHLESSLAIHAEAKVVALAAKHGTSLQGADVYVNTFPCPPCAKQLAYAGIKRLYYEIGYKVLDGERILRSQGVEIIFVEPK